MDAVGNHGLYLLRHAKSSWDDPSVPDVERPLADRGLRSAAAMRDRLATIGLHVDRVLCSPSARTRATWQIVSAGIAGNPQVSFEPAIYDASLSELLALVHGLDDHLKATLIVGHNPGMEVLATTLAGDGKSAALDRLRAKYPTGALAVLKMSGHWRDLGRGDAYLADFIVPADLPGD
jgi:phosphohistidine phosphatase